MAQEAGIMVRGAGVVALDLEGAGKRTKFQSTWHLTQWN